MCTSVNRRSHSTKGDKCYAFSDALICDGWSTWTRCRKIFLQQNGREIFAACGVFELCKYGKGPILMHTFTTFLFANFVLESIIAWTEHCNHHLTKIHKARAKFKLFTTGGHWPLLEAKTISVLCYLCAGIPFKHLSAFLKALIAQNLLRLFACKSIENFLKYKFGQIRHLFLCLVQV